MLAKDVSQWSNREESDQDERRAKVWRRRCKARDGEMERDWTMKHCILIWVGSVRSVSSARHLGIICLLGFLIMIGYSVQPAGSMSLF